MASEMRIVVLVGEANGELLDDLSRVSTRARAERLRVLATLGLQSLGQRVSVQRDVLPPVARAGRAGPAAKTSKSKNVPEPVLDANQDVADMEPAEQSNTTGRKSNSTLKKFVKSLG